MLSPVGPCVLGAAIGLAGMPALAEQPSRPTLSFYGVTGLIDMPSAEMQPDGQLSATMAHFGGVTRTSLTFQLFPRMSGTFRYTGVQDWNSGGFDTYYDRSFDVRFQAIREGEWARWMPAVTIGIQDLAGTGLYSGEYIVATKHVADQLKITAGLGWGRLGSYGDIGSTGTRPAVDVGEGGEFNANTWFRGPFAPFGGIEWQPTERLSLKAEYSSDAYTLEDDERGVFDRGSPWNFGASYRVSDSVTLGAWSMYGTEFGVSANLSWSPNDPANPGSVEGAPTPVRPRVSRSDDPEAWSTAWTGQSDASAILAGNTQNWLKDEGISVQAMDARATEVTVWIENRRYDAEAQAIGRTARALSRAMPASIELFHIVPLANGLPLSRVSLRRSDIEALETAPDGGAAILARATMTDSGPRPPRSYFTDAGYGQFQWGLAPNIDFGFFDPDEPIRGDLDLSLWGSYEAVPGLVFSGAVSKRIVGNIGDSTRTANSELYPVRSNAAIYAREGDPGIDSLTAAYFFKPGESLYGRATVGYLETMYGGASGELLWKPVDSRLALGAEVNYARQRDFDMGFGFQDYDVVTGHLSAYYELGGGYQARIDAGRYLAGDWGTTLTFNREFRNGWAVGAFATFTDVSAEDFGEGSFDKGINLTIPLSWFIARPSRNSINATVRPLNRDGGRRLNVSDRLYGLVSDYDALRIEDTSARFWR
jgi:hypothetical protein